jgi:copper chaperone NosL
MKHFNISQRKPTVYLAIIVLVTVLFLQACGIEYQAQAINEETDRCTVCNMAVNDDAHATQIATVDGKTLKFDDIGCMYKWMSENDPKQIGMAFVRDFHDLSWLNYEEATYVYDATFKTPMAYGVLSFKDSKSAQLYVKEQGKGKVWSAEELKNHDWKVNREMKKMHNTSNINMEGQKTHSQPSMPMNDYK